MPSWVVASKDFFWHLMQKEMLKKITQTLTCSKTKLLNLICSLEIVFVSINE